MPTKSDRRVPLPAGLLPLLTQPELETYYQVSDWTVLRWIEDGMPVEPGPEPQAWSVERLAEIAARAAAATPGPWGFYDGDNYADVAADLEQTSRGSYSYRHTVSTANSTCVVSS